MSAPAAIDFPIMQDPLAIALKEWAIICELLLSGRQALVLRKGGVHEEAGPGRFRLDHPRFLLFPAWEHERLDWVKPAWRTRDIPVEAEPEVIPLGGYAEVAGVWEVPTRAAFDELDDLHAWAKPQVDMRFNYKPARPIFAVALRCYRFASPQYVPNRPRYAGCKSWVDLEPEDEVPVNVLQRAEAAMGEKAFDTLMMRIRDALEPH